MKSHEDAAFRIKLAREYLRRAEKNHEEKDWDSCLRYSQEAVENAGKAILSHFRPVPISHDLDLDKDIAALLKRKNISPDFRKRIQQVLDAFHDMGTKTHIRAAYGDEQAHITPWELITESEAKMGMDKARRAVALAEAIYAEMTQPPPSSEINEESKN